MQALYRIKTSKYFEKAKKAGFDGLEDDPYAVMQIALSTGGGRYNSTRALLETYLVPEKLDLVPRTNVVNVSN